MNVNPGKTAEACYNEVLTMLHAYNSTKRVITEESATVLQSSIFSTIMNSFPGMILVFDLHTSGYVYISENAYEMIGFEREEFLTGGLHRTMQLFQPSHNQIIIQHIFPTMFGFFEKFCLSGDYEGLTGSYPVQLCHKDGKKRWYLHTTKVLTTDPLNRPYLLLKTLSDIEDIKKDQYIDFAITKKARDGKIETLFRKSFYPQTTLDILSSREFEIMELICKGFTNAQIADKLFISLHTVKAHRRNIITKTKCKGTAELANLAMAWQNK
jgi:DNA-binding CsgD family transcriptional regulator